jgi:hypothetical protein
MFTSLVALVFGLVVAPQGAPAPAPQAAPAGIPSGRPPSHRLLAPTTAPDLGGIRSGGTTRSGSRGAPPLAPPGPPNNPNVRVNSSNTADQDETPLRVDPNDRLHLISGANDDRNGPYTCAFYATFDGGLTWNELFFPDPGGFGEAGDPAVAFGPVGETYFEALAFSGNSAIYVGRSDDGGLTVPNANWVKAVPERARSFADKPAMVVDTGGGTLSKAVYVTWTRFNNSGTTPIMVTASFDSGATWSPATRLSDSDFCQGSSCAVGPNGELDVAYYDMNTSSIQFDTSPDGGVTWGTDVKIADAPFLGGVPNSGFRTNSFPSLDVDTSGGPFNGRIYACWATDLGTGSGPDVMIANSSDGGATWSTPIPASDVTTNTQFSPWLDVDANGNVNVGFYDRRDDATDIKIRYYVSRSSDGGATFQPNVKASDDFFNPNKNPQGFFIGDYTGLAASDRSIHGVWTDERNGDNDVYTARVQLDIHTDVPAISAATGGTANITLNPGPLYQNEPYRILGSISGTSPGLDFNGVNVPLNFDFFMLITVLDANSPALPGFVGTLDATGSATAALVAGPLPPSAVGLQMDFAAFVKVGSAVRWASNPTHLEITP